MHELEKLPIVDSTGVGGEGVEARAEVSSTDPAAFNCGIQSSLRNFKFKPSLQDRKVC